jgi:hypothetical protein
MAITIIASRRSLLDFLPAVYQVEALPILYYQAQVKPTLFYIDFTSFVPSMSVNSAADAALSK